MTDRHHFLDTCRALLMFLGIPYHVAQVYSTSPWLVGAQNDSLVFDYLALLTHAFRMPAFFVVAGFFALLLINRTGPQRWLGRRMERIGVPLIAALIISTPLQIVAIQYVAAMQADLEFGPGSLLSWLLAWLADPASDKVFHLWFLPELLVFSALLAALVATGAWARTARILDMMAARLPSGLLAVIVFAAWGAYAYGAYASGRILGRDLFLLGLLDVQSLLRHLPFFLFGAVLAARRDFFERFTRPSRMAWICAIAALFAWVGAGPDPDRVPNLIRILIGPATAILMTHLVLSGARTLLDRPNPLVRLGTESAFTVYLAHQPIILMLAVVMIPMDLPPASGFLLMVAATTLIALGLHLAVSWSRLLTYLFNGIRPSAQVRVPGGPGPERRTHSAPPPRRPHGSARERPAQCR